MKMEIKPNKIKEQLDLLYETKKIKQNTTYLEKLDSLLKGDLNFHKQHSFYSSHNFHSFPAKYPPQLPKLFIKTVIY